MFCVSEKTMHLNRMLEIAQLDGPEHAYRRMSADSDFHDNTDQIIS